MTTRADARPAIGREQIDAHYHRTLTTALRGPHAPERAALVLAIVAGVQVMRQMGGLPALAAARPEALTTLLTPVLESLLEGDKTRSARGRVIRTR
jgi:hypothetical protein